MLDTQILTRLKTVLPQTAPYFTEQLSVIPTYNGTEILFDVPQSIGESDEFMISSSSVSVRVIGAVAKVFRDKVTRCVELEFEGYIPFVFDIREPRLNTITLTYELGGNDGTSVTFPVLDINQETNKVYIKHPEVPEEALRLYYKGPAYHIHGTKKKGIDYVYADGQIRMQEPQFYNYEGAELFIDYNVFIHFVIQDENKVRSIIATDKKELTDKKCHLIIQPNVATFVPRVQQQNDVGIVDFSEGSAMTLRYLNNFDITAMCYGFGTQEGVAPYKFLKECTDLVISALTGYTPDFQGKPYVNRPLYCSQIDVAALAGDRGASGLRMQFLYFTEYREVITFKDHLNIMNINSFSLSGEFGGATINSNHNFKDYTNDLEDAP
jgi:hypothetical protein